MHTAPNNLSSPLHPKNVSPDEAIKRQKNIAADKKVLI